jgi:ATP-dependent Clp protease, protease subunit
MIRSKGRTVLNRLTRLLIENRGVSFEGRGLRIEAKAGSEPTIYIYDVIVANDAEAEFWGGVSAESFVKEVRALEAKTIHVRINSPGGDVFAARAMQAALRDSGAKIVAHVDGIAASAASFIAVQADETIMGEGSMLMLHKSWAMQIGNADDMRQTADILDKNDLLMAQTYARASGLSEAEVMGLLAAETWMTPDESMAHGFADSIDLGTKVENHWKLDALRREKDATSQGATAAVGFHTPDPAGSTPAPATINEAPRATKSHADVSRAMFSHKFGTSGALANHAEVSR